MYIVNGIAYAGNLSDEIEVRGAIALDELMLLITFSTGEKRIFDATELLQYPAFQPLKDDRVFQSFEIEHGVLTWLNGDIDIAPETLYEHSHRYSAVV